jgi:DNA polymerase I-like protein with 3'-5' exonuclease and polymerase domains
VTILTVDMETYYSQQFSLSKITTEEYVRDSRFEVIGVAVKVDDGETQWFSGTTKQTKAWLDRFDWGNSIAIAHNAMFDMAIMNWRFDIRPKRIVDTLSMLRAIDGPDAGNSLAKAAERYGLGVKGTEVINALGKRRLDFTAEELARYGEYCINDTELTYKLAMKLLDGFPKEELQLIDLTMRMFTEPVLALDKAALEAHLASVKAHKEALMAKMNYDKAELMSNPKLAELLEFHGVVPPKKISPTTGKETFAFAKNDEAFKALLEHENDQVQAIVAARLGVKSTLEETRTERFIKIAERGTLPVPLRYYAAHTGRFGGDDKVNLQNLPRKSPLKKAIKAPPGYVIIDCDSSQIEARTLAWLAGQWDLVEAFEKGEDVYKIMASSIYGVPVEEVTDGQRFVGKTTILGCFGPDTKVLTDNGWKRIVEVKATDTLWDGEEWVTHNGVIPQGVKETITAYGVSATPDHAILTEHGWREWNAVLIDPSLFQSAIDKATSPSPAGSVVTEGITPLFDAIAVGKELLTAKISKLGAALGAIHALKKRLTSTAKNIGVMLTSSPIMTTGNGYLTASLRASHGVTTHAQKHSLIMGGVASTFTNRGAQTEARSYATSPRLKGGKTPSATSTVSIILKGMNQAISASLRAVKTPETNALPALCKQKLMTYDIAYAGPRNRYTIATDAGPIIVHNCGYGMGAKKFQAQLKTFGVTLELEECERIIAVYRETYPYIPKLWRDTGDALESLVVDHLTSIGEGMKLAVAGGIVLPNMLRLRYPNLRFILNDKGKQEMVYDTKKGRAVIPTRIYGGKCVENICQALARIIIANQMLMIARRYKVAMTVHDSVVPVVPEAEAVEARAFIEQCMRIRPKWAAALPLNCESKMGASYGG